jgi:hypothetical protein
MARPLIRRRITVTGRQRADIDTDLLTQALVQIIEDEADHASVNTPPTSAAPTQPPARHRRPDRPTRPTTTAVPSPRTRPAGRTGESTRPGSPGSGHRTPHPRAARATTIDTSRREGGKRA